jgi:predicted metal-binding membrane protein
VAVPRPYGAAVALIGAALLAWIVTYQRMHGMDAGPGTDLGAVGWYVGIWVTMMAAMMLPSVMPMVLVFARISRDRARRGDASVPTSIFVGGYLLVWTVYGLLAYGAFRGFRWAIGGSLSWSGAGPWVAGAALVAAGVYQLTPLKRVCLRHCRGPLHFILHGWRPGRAGAFRMGIEHGLFCVGCCWGLMLALFGLGVMSLVWMAAVAGIVFAEKVLPVGEHVTRVAAVALAAGGIWIAAAPASVPGLVQPDSPAAQRARDRMMGMPPAMKPMQKPRPAKTNSMTPQGMP